MTKLIQPQGNFLERLARWEEMQTSLKKLKAAEILLRKELFGEAFPEPKEGTSYMQLAGGWRLKSIYKLERSIEVIHLAQMRDELATRFAVSIDPLLGWTPTLKMAPYNALEEDVRKFFNNIVTAKPGSPQLSLVAPTDDQIPELASEKAEMKKALELVDIETGEVTIHLPAAKKARKTRTKKVVS